MLRKDSFERSKAVAPGAIPQGPGFEPQSCQLESHSVSRYAAQLSAVTTRRHESYTRSQTSVTTQPELCMLLKDSLAERSKAVAQGAIP